MAADVEDIIISCCLPPYHLQSCMSKISTFSRHKSHPPETHQTHSLVRSVLARTGGQLVPLRCYLPRTLFGRQLQTYVEMTTYAQDTLEPDNHHESVGSCDTNRETPPKAPGAEFYERLQIVLFTLRDIELNPVYNATADVLRAA